MARVPAPEGRAGSDRVRGGRVAACPHALPGRHVVRLLPVRLSFILWGYAVREHTGVGVVGRPATVASTYPAMLTSEGCAQPLPSALDQAHA